MKKIILILFIMALLMGTLACESYEEDITSTTIVIIDEQITWTDLYKDLGVDHLKLFFQFQLGGKNV